MTKTNAEKRYRVTRIPFADDLKKQIAADWLAELHRELGNPWQRGLVVILVLSLIGLGCAYLFTPFWWPLFVGVSLIGVVMGCLIAFNAHNSYKKVKFNIEELNALSVVYEYRLSLDGPHLFIPHEHGLLLFVPIRRGITFFYDLSNCSNNPLHLPVSEALKNAQLSVDWRWLQLIPHEKPMFLTLSGKTIAPEIGREFDDPEDCGSFLGFIYGKMKDEYRIERDFEKIRIKHKELLDRRVKS